MDDQKPPRLPFLPCCCLESSLILSLCLSLCLSCTHTHTHRHTIQRASAQAAAWSSTADGNEGALLNYFPYPTTLCSNISQVIFPLRWHLLTPFHEPLTTFPLQKPGFICKGNMPWTARMWLFLFPLIMWINLTSAFCAQKIIISLFFCRS